MQFSAGEEDQSYYHCIDLGTIGEKAWAHNLLKDRNQKSIPMHTQGLIDFVTTASAIFGVFKTKINESMRYFFMYLDIKS
jgi:hypothetical protein